MVENEKMTVYCPLLKEEIYDGDCYEIVHCGYGEIKKTLHPEVKDWCFAIAVCAKCKNNQAQSIINFNAICSLENDYVKAYIFTGLITMFNPTKILCYLYLQV